MAVKTKKFVPHTKKEKAKFKKVMHEFGQGELPMGNSDMTVTNPKQALAIAFSESKKYAHKADPKKHKPKEKHHPKKKHEEPKKEEKHRQHKVHKKAHAKKGK